MNRGSQVVAEGAKEAVPDVEKSIPASDREYPTKEQLLEVLHSMAGLSEEDKAKLREDLLKDIHGDLPNTGTITSNITIQITILFALLALVALIFVFFTYKLLKCLKEREQKREEKKKNKQLKKKK